MPNVLDKVNKDEINNRRKIDVAKRYSPDKELAMSDYEDESVFMDTFDDEDEYDRLAGYN